MDRHNKLHEASRVALPASVGQPEVVTTTDRRWRLARSAAGLIEFAGMVGFLGCGAAVIATASLLALHIQ